MIDYLLCKLVGSSASCEAKEDTCYMTVGRKRIANQQFQWEKAKRVKLQYGENSEANSIEKYITPIIRYTQTGIRKR